MLDRPLDRRFVEEEARSLWGGKKTTGNRDLDKPLVA
jgi:hypothetical protein